MISYLDVVSRHVISYQYRHLWHSNRQTGGHSIKFYENGKCIWILAQSVGTAPGLSPSFTPVAQIATNILLSAVYSIHFKHYLWLTAAISGIKQTDRGNLFNFTPLKWINREQYIILDCRIARISYQVDMGVSNALDNSPRDAGNYLWPRLTGGWPPMLRPSWPRVCDMRRGC